jgi:tRNA-Thr(GGU) m(6)t(6)A37 methyltransferase TsaA
MRRLKPIGIIHTPFVIPEGTPIQHIYANDAEGVVEVLAEYADGLSDLDGFERVWLLYLLDRAPAARLKVVPFRDSVLRGVFATRAPSRPNPIGLSAVRLLGIEGRNVRVADVDMLDGTPLLDIKPYIPRADSFPDSRAGWFDLSQSRQERADDRFK